MMTFEEQRSFYQDRCEKNINRITKKVFLSNSVVSEAALYSLLGGGKRVRGVLVLAICDLLEGQTELADVFSAAIEMIHAFSLVHDDLPCMDDDDFRRGKPSTHKKYGQANALLAGDLLAIEAFGIISSEVGNHPLQAVQAVQILSAAAGARGMIYGQELDLRYEKETAGNNELYDIQKYKTGALIEAAARLGICAAGKEVEKYAVITKYANNIGLAFQIVDDILDVCSTDEILGKPVGSDQTQGKTTFVTMFGLTFAQQEVQRLTQEATELLSQKYGGKSNYLCKYAMNLAERIR